mmetsp:Transcript_60106/g.143235  ORF Transcript_60106/g.143235 Transcript_60106/m.143235 type:complete len:87 (-) Transcript_60106:635-895(-)
MTLSSLHASPNRIKVQDGDALNSSQRNASTCHFAFRACQAPVPLPESARRMSDASAVSAWPPGYRGVWNHCCRPSAAASSSWLQKY